MVERPARVLQAERHPMLASAHRRGEHLEEEIGMRRTRANNGGSVTNRNGECMGAVRLAPGGGETKRNLKSN